MTIGSSKSTLQVGSRVRLRVGGETGRVFWIGKRKTTWRVGIILDAHCVPGEDRRKTFRFFSDFDVIG